MMIHSHLNYWKYRRWDLCRRATNANRFSLVFRGPNTDTPVQKVYMLQLAELGQLELFLVPIGPDETGMLYEAVFT